MKSHRLSQGSSQRGDIQGLRAVAVLTVVIYHLWPEAMPGGFTGVDVFFVISGFLITTHLLQARPRSMSDLVSFWARRVRRLLPAALLVLFVTLAMTVLLVPDTRWTATARHIVAAALYFENWQAAADSVDYLRADEPPTPAQHYWSLSVEEQFYLVWPVLILAFGALARLLKSRPARVITGAMTVVVAVSFVLSVLVTAKAPASAYFSTPVRIWELGAGGLLAAVAGSAALRRGGRLWWSLVATAGLLAIVYTAFEFSKATPFPSWRAALPVGGCLAVIAAGLFSRRTLAGELLELRPMQFIGDISYSIYLWHWPLIVLLPYVSGGRLGYFDKAAIIVGSIALAALTKGFIEDPFRRPGTGWLRRAPFRFAAAGMAVVVIAGFGVMHEVDSRRSDERAALAAAMSDPCFGAGTMALGAERCPRPRNEKPVLTPAAAQNDLPILYRDKCFEYPPFAATTTCTYGDPNAKISIALVGNSHAGHWFPAIQPLLDDFDVKVTTYLASGCNITTTRMEWNPRAHGARCLEWAERVMKATTSGQFDLVVTSAIQTRVPEAVDWAGAGWPGRRPINREGMKLLRVGHLNMLKRWVAAKVDVVVIKDTPAAPGAVGPVPDCVANHEGDVHACSAPRSTWSQPDPLFEAATVLAAPEVTTVDLTDKFCSSQTCHGVIGSVIVFSDGHHLTQTYARTLTPYLAGPFGDAVRRASPRA